MRQTWTPKLRGWRPIERYAFVPRPYDEVWPWLAGHLSTLGDPLAGGDRSIAVHIRPAGKEISRPVRVQVGGLVCVEGRARAALGWADAAHPRLFPRLTAILELRPVPSDRQEFTQIGVLARYRPPFGPVGTVGDHLLGGDVVDVTLTNFLDDLVGVIMDQVVEPEGSEPEAVVDLVEGGDPAVRRLFMTVDGLGVRPGGAVGVYEALTAVPGVTRVSIDPLNGLVAVDHHPEQGDLPEMLAALEYQPAVRSRS